MLRRSARSALLLVGAAGWAACGGTITFGTDKPGADAGNTVDGADSGISDSGAMMMIPDAGPCRQRAEPTFPSAWPYPSTKQAYLEKFYNALPMRAGCSSTTCHGMMQPPLIPTNETDLDQPATLSAAITQLWPRAIPGPQTGAPGPVSLLLWKHRMNGGVVPSLIPTQVNFLMEFERKAKACAWKPIIDREAMTGPMCSGGVCDCPITVDVSHCR